jgi:hypothetical protein
MCVVCVLCLIVVPLPRGENTFAVKINNNNNNNKYLSAQEKEIWKLRDHLETVI